MTIQVCAVGGYGEVGKNMTAVKIDDDVIILDMGIRLDRIILNEDTAFENKSAAELIEIGGMPDDTVIREWASKVRAIVISHGHLDHIGAVSKLAAKYNAPILATPYTAALARQMVEDQRVNLKKPIVRADFGKHVEVSPNIEIEFVNITHSIVDTALVAIHTPHGSIIYANDFKLDNLPVLGKKPDYERMKALGKQRVIALIIESTRVTHETKTPSESIVKKMLADCLYDAGDGRQGLVITTFSSHLARIKSICEIANKMDKKTLLLGRSMTKYSGLAIEEGIVRYPGDVTISNGTRETEKLLRRAEKNKEEYVLVVTGHQGESMALLSKIADDRVPFHLARDDRVIFSSTIIPTPINVSNRATLDSKLRMRGARLIKDIHVSGHASRADHEVLLSLLQPETIIPCHGDLDMMAHYVEMAETFGYKLNYNIFLLRNGQEVELPTT